MSNTLLYDNCPESFSVFLDCPKMYFQKNTFFRYILQILNFGPENFRQVVILS